MPSDSKTVVSRLLQEVWNAGNVGLLDELIDGDYRAHIDETHPIRTSRHTGPGIPRTELAAYRSAMPNLRVDVETLVADGDAVVAIWTITGDNTGDAIVDQGDEVIPSSGRAIEATAFGVFTVRGGKIAEARIGWAPIGPLDQMRLFATGTLEIHVSGERITLTR